MKNRILLGVLPIFVFGCQNSKNETGDPPNILLIVSEDHGPHLSCYGDTIIKTPNLDKIAEEGILFKNAYVTQSVCSPSRSSILTGLYVHQNGHLGLATHGYHFVGEITNIYQLLKNAGYRTAMIGKLHLSSEHEKYDGQNPDSSFPIDFHPITGGNFAKRGLHRYWEYADSFMNASEDPFFLMINFPDAHGDWQDQIDGRPASPLTPDDVVTFPYIGIDNNRLRGMTANYYNCILRLDECIGELMNILSGSGLKKNTLVIFLSDHGDQMARGKIHVYEAGVKVPFLVKWPGRISEGIVSEALISTIDIVPTILDAVNLNIPENLPGKSMTPLFDNPNINFREYLFTERNADAKDFYFPQRAVRDERYKLIYSLLDDRSDPAAEWYTRDSIDSRHNWFKGGPTSDELKTAPASIKSLYYKYRHPPQIKLYDLKNDPWEFNDIANDPQYFDVKKNLLITLFNWQENTNDPLRLPEKLRELTTEHDTIEKSARYEHWCYPEYLYRE